MDIIVSLANQLTLHEHPLVGAEEWLGMTSHFPPYL
jgi:hypothetical protein